MKASVSANIWKLLLYSISFLLPSKLPLPAPHSDTNLCYGSKVRPGQLAHCDSEVSQHRAQETAPFKTPEHCRMENKEIFLQLILKIKKNDNAACSKSD